MASLAPILAYSSPSRQVVGFPGIDLDGFSSSVAFFSHQIPLLIDLRPLGFGSL